MYLKTFSREDWNYLMRKDGVSDKSVENYDNSFYISCVSSCERGSPNEKLFFNYNHQNAITEVFDDITPQTLEYYKREKSHFGFGGDYKIPDYKLFTKEQAREVVGFVERIGADSKVYIHCAAGVSRSGAIGYYIANKFGIIEKYLKDNPQVNPNPYVLTLLLEASNESNHTTYRTGDVVSTAQRRTRHNYYV